VWHAELERRPNSFPDHPLWRLLVDGGRRFDIDDAPARWGNPSDRLLPSLNPAEAEIVLASVKQFVAYGSEVGQPCHNPFCCG